MDIVVTHDHDITDRDDVRISRKVDDCSVWVVNKDEDIKLMQLNSWISYITNTRDFARMKRKVASVLQ